MGEWAYLEVVAPIGVRREDRERRGGKEAEPGVPSRVAHQSDEGFAEGVGSIQRMAHQLCPYALALERRIDTDRAQREHWLFLHMCPSAGQVTGDILVHDGYEGQERKPGISASQIVHESGLDRD